MLFLSWEDSKIIEAQALKPKAEFNTKAIIVNLHNWSKSISEYQKSTNFPIVNHFNS